MARRELETQAHPPPPKGWKYWYTIHWEINRAILVESKFHYKLVLYPSGQVAAQLGFNEKVIVNIQDDPPLLYVYHPVIIPATPEDLRDPDKFAQLTQPNQEDR